MANNQNNIVGINDINDNNDGEENPLQAGNMAAQNNNNFLVNEDNQGNNEINTFQLKINRDIFIPFTAFIPNFGAGSPYYSKYRIDPYKENIFVTLQSLVFPNANWLDLSVISCYLSIILFIVSLILGTNTRDTENFLCPKISSLTKVGSFFPNKMRGGKFIENYRLLLFHFLHVNFWHLICDVFILISCCTFIETLMKRKVYIIITFLIGGILGNLTSGFTFKDREQNVGCGSGISALLGGMIVVYVLNWKELTIVFGSFGKYLSLFLICCIIFLVLIYLHLKQYSNNFVEFFSFIYGVLVFGTISRPVFTETWKERFRYIVAGLLVVAFIVNILLFYVFYN